jgi:hypothetical protein
LILGSFPWFTEGFTQPDKHKQTNDMKKIGKKDILLKCLNEMFSDKLEEDEFTIAELVRQSKANGKEIHRSKWKHRMVNLIKQGKATSRKALIDGSWTLVYRML